jgi:transcriptional activator SPT7
MPPRKRVKYESPIKGDDLCQLWWTAVQSEELFGNGMPGIPYGIASKRTNKRKKRKKPSSPLPSKALLNMMHANIRTLRRIRRTHAKYAALNLASSGNKEDDIEGELPPPPPPVLAEGEDDIEDNIDERRWEPVGSGIEIGERQADSCLKWANGKILEHAGFQGTYKV